MNAVNISNGYWGLRPIIRFRIEIGFVFADDGERIWKISSYVFQELISQGTENLILPNEIFLGLIESLPTVFCKYPTYELALATFCEQEI